MSSKEFNVVAIIYPKAGKADKVLESLHEVAKYVKDKEPGTLKYEINRVTKPAKDGTEDIVMLERYKDMAALKTHGSSDPFNAHQKRMEDGGLLRAPNLLKIVSDIGGFSSRL